MTGADPALSTQIVASAINGMLAGLIRIRATWIPVACRDLQVQTRGEFGGLGIEVTMEDGLVKVVAPIDDTPAAKAGVMANDPSSSSTTSRCTA